MGHRASATSPPAQPAEDQADATQPTARLRPSSRSDDGRAGHERQQQPDGPDRPRLRGRRGREPGDRARSRSAPPPADRRPAPDRCGARRRVRRMARDAWPWTARPSVSVRGVAGWWRSPVASTVAGRSPTPARSCSRWRRRRGGSEPCDRDAACRPRHVGRPAAPCRPGRRRPLRARPPAPAPGAAVAPARSPLERRLAQAAWGVRGVSVLPDGSLSLRPAELEPEAAAGRSRLRRRALRRAAGLRGRPGRSARPGEVPAHRARSPSVSPSTPPA